MLAMLQLMERYHYVTPAGDLPRATGPESAGPGGPGHPPGSPAMVGGQGRHREGEACPQVQPVAVPNALEVTHAAQHRV